MLAIGSHAVVSNESFDLNDYHGSQQARILTIEVLQELTSNFSFDTFTLSLYTIDTKTLHHGRRFKEFERL